MEQENVGQDVVVGTASGPRTFLIAAACLVTVLAVLGAFWLYSGYQGYVSQQQATLNIAEARADDDIASFSAGNSEVAVDAVNNTGGTAYVYIGQSGKMQSVGDGVQAPATPNLVATLAPHSRTSLVVRDWLTKYITVTTQYIWLGSVRTQPVLLANLTYVPRRTSQPDTTFVYAPANSSDSNFVYGSASDDIAPQKSGMDVAAVQATRISRYAKDRAVRPENYPTDFGSYLSSLLNHTDATRAQAFVTH